MATTPQPARGGGFGKEVQLVRRPAPYVAVAALTVVLLLSPSASALNGFTDVPPDAYYATAVDWLLDQGITTGTTCTCHLNKLGTKLINAITGERGESDVVCHPGVIPAKAGIQI